MTFIEYIDDILFFKTDDESEKYYNRYSLGYNILNITGIDNESNIKSSFKNTFNDGLHSYYSSFYDLFVTNDSGTKEKSKIMFETFGIETKFIDPSNFKEYISIIDGIKSE